MRSPAGQRWPALLSPALAAARVAGLIVMGALVARTGAAAPPGNAPVSAPVMAPVMALELPRLDGTSFVRLADFEGRLVLLNFWGRECPPCVREMPLLFALAPQHPAVQFLGVAVDERADASRFLQGQRPTYPQLVAPKQPEVLLRRFGNRLGALPYTVLLDARHQVCATRLGEVDAAWVLAAIGVCGAGR